MNAAAARRLYLSALTRAVDDGTLGASQAVVLSYRYDHPDASLEDAARAVGVPVSLVRTIAA